MTSRLLPLLVLLAGCVTNPVGPQAEAMPVRGAVERLASPEHARIEIYRLTNAGIPQRVPGLEARPRPDGSFTTPFLLPGRYLLALRAPDRPVSVARVPVPPAPPVRLVARRPEGHAALQLQHDVPDVESLDVLLSRVEGDVPVADRRRVAVRSKITSQVSGLGPGRWRLDVLGTGATTHVTLPDEEETVPLTISPPPVGTAAEMMGRVFRIDGEPAVGVAVTVHPLLAGTRDPAPWGRYAVTDSDGGYRLAGLPEGRVLLRVECRDAVHRLLPLPEIVTIPPSGVVRRSFVIEP